MSEYEPRTYTKNGAERVAHSPSDAVALEFDGYSPVEDEAPQDQAPAESAPENAPEQPEAVEPGSPAPEQKAPKTGKA